VVRVARRRIRLGSLRFGHEAFRFFYYPLRKRHGGEWVCAPAESISLLENVRGSGL
jgi:hypothetical protein